MALFDMVGDCDLRIPLEANSDPELYGLFAAASGATAIFEGHATGSSTTTPPSPTPGSRRLT